MKLAEPCNGCTQLLGIIGAIVQGQFADGKMAQHLGFYNQWLMVRRSIFTLSPRDSKRSQHALI